MSKLNTRKLLKTAIDDVDTLINAILAGMQNASDYKDDAAINKDLEQLLNAFKIPTSNKGTARRRFVSYIIEFIKTINLQQLRKYDMYKQFIEVLQRIGRAFSERINANDETHQSIIKDIRKAIKTQFGDEEGVKIIKDSQISDSKRTMRRNMRREKIVEAKHEKPIKVSLEEVKRCIDKMKADIDSGDVKYQNVICLLSELAFGARSLEIYDKSKFKLITPKDPKRVEVETRRITRSLAKKLESEEKAKKKIEYILQQGILKKRNKKREGSEDEDDYELINIEVEKPVFPLIDGKYTLKKLNEWRENLANRWAASGIEKDDSKNQYGTIRTNNNILLRERYLFIRDLPAKEISSHILRKLYAVFSYYLLDGKYDGETMTLQGFVKRVLAHEKLSVGNNYSHFIIVNDKTREQIFINDKSEENQQLREQIQQLREENDRLKKQIEELLKK